MDKERPKVGVGVYILKGDKVLMGLRKGSHGSMTWCPPGGHLEYGETPEQCAIREVQEEAGIKIKNLKHGAWTNDVFEKEGKHYITVCMIADYDSGEPKIMEPEKLVRWEWFKWDELPQPLFLPVENGVKSGFNPFEKKALNLF